MPVKPMLGGIELQQVQKIETDEDQVLTQHSVPALEGDFLQGLGRSATRVTLTCVTTGPQAGTNLKTLRDKYRAGEPVPFVADIATATKVDQVLIEELGVRELAGKPARFEFRLTLREFIPPPRPETEEPPPEPPTPKPPDPAVGTLVVEVIVEDEPDFDFSKVNVTAEGTQENGAPLSRVMTQRENNFWTEERMPPGRYTVRALVTEPESMSGQVQATVHPGQTEQVQIILRRGALLAKAFIIHFRFDSAFFEPCMREVLERVFTYAQAHPTEKIVVVGHTDKQGSEDYNQQLSERRARSVFAFLTFGTSPALQDAGVVDWDQLWRPGHAGLHDEWSVREYQYMLQDLEYYVGNIDEIHEENTSAAVQDFQGDHGLPETGVVNAATWKELVTAYLEAGALGIAEDRFLRNADPEAGCDGGTLKWLGCGEQDPVRNTEDAWRPNRRTEILFVREERLPCRVPPPVTFNQPQPGAVSSQWCLGPGDVNKRSCFTTRPKENEQPAPGKWQVLPAEPDRVAVSGTIKFEDNSPLANEEYVLIAPDGEFLHHDGQGKADLGEVAQGNLRGRPIPMRTDDAGRFDHPESTPVGIYILQLPKLTEPAVARADEDPPGAAIGNVVCMHFEPPEKTSSTGATVHRSRPAPDPVNPAVTAGSQVVVVKKSHTSPARVPILLQTNVRFRRRGTLTRTVIGAGGNIRIFNAAQGGTEITFDGTDNVFTGNSMTAGVRLFAESDSPSSTLNDVQLTLTLAPGPTPVGAPATLSLTAVALLLDISGPRTAPGAPFQPLPQPPAIPPAPGAATDKWFGGVVVSAQDPGNSQARGQLIVAQVVPTAFAGDLILRQVRIVNDNIAGLDNKLQLFDNEIPGSRQTPPVAETPKPNPFEFDATTITSAAGRQFFIEGRQVSGALRDTGFQLGIKDIENDGGRVAVTVAVGAVITVASSIVVVKKSYTNPARQLVTLQTTATFNRNGTLTRSSNEIRFFTAAQGGTEITFDGTDNVFGGDQLTNGVQLFAEGASPSPGVDLFQLTLTLDPGPPPLAGPAAIVKMTAVELTLDICVPRTSPGVDPAPLSVADKINTGRFVQLRNSGNSHVRAMLIVRRPNPFIAVTLEIAPIIEPNNGLVQAFTSEIPAANQTPVSNPHTILSGIIPPNGVQFFAEGISLSRTARDAGFKLGIQGLEDEADRVAISVFDLALTDNVAPFDTSVDRVQIEGILNVDRTSFDLGDLFGTQPDSLFRARLDIPGVAGNTIQARLVSNRANGTNIVTPNITLTRTSGDRFVSRPVLAVPEALLQVAPLPLAAFTFRAPQNLEVVPCVAGGRLRLETAGAVAGVGALQARVRGRVVQIFASAITGAGITEAAIRQEIQVTNQVWAQAGIEVRERGIDSSVADPDTLLNLDGFDINPFTATLTPEEQALLALRRSGVNSDVNVYYVRSIDNGVSGEGISSDEFSAVTDPTGSGIILAVTPFNTNQAHELGHLLVHNGDEHSVSGVARPAANLMHPTSVTGQRDLDSGQVLRAIRPGNPFVVIVE